MGGGGAKIAAPPGDPAPTVAAPAGTAEAAAAAAITAPNPASGAPASPSPTTTGAPALPTPVVAPTPAGTPVPPFLATTASAGDRGGVVLLGVRLLGSPPAAALPAVPGKPAPPATGVVAPPLPTDSRGDGDAETTLPLLATGGVRGVNLPGRAGAGVAAAVAVPGAGAKPPLPLTGVRPSTGLLPSTGVFFADPPPPPAIQLAPSFPPLLLLLSLKLSLGPPPPPVLLLWSFPSPTRCDAHAEASAQAGDIEGRRRRRSFLADRASHSARASAALGEKLRVPLPADTVDPGTTEEKIACGGVMVFQVSSGARKWEGMNNE